MRTELQEGEISAWAKEAGITRQYLHMVLRRERKPSFDVIVKLCSSAKRRGLKLEPQDFWIEGNPLFRK